MTTKSTGKARNTESKSCGQSAAESGAPHSQPPTDGWRNHPAAAGLLEYNFS